MDLLHQLFSRLSQANLTVNLAKSEFGHCQVTFLGHVVGQGQFSPVMAKVEAVSCFPEPQNKRELMSFWVWQGITESSATTFLWLLLH